MYFLGGRKKATKRVMTSQILFFMNCTRLSGEVVVVVEYSCYSTTRSLGVGDVLRVLGSGLLII